MIYLGVEEQEALGYNLLQHLSWNSFSRKALGYLYAMQVELSVHYFTRDAFVNNVMEPNVNNIKQRKKQLVTNLLKTNEYF